MRLIYLNNPQLNREQQGYIHNINQHVYNKKPLVIYFYKEGCPYCIQTSKEWENIGQYVDNTQNDDLLAVQANGDLYNLLQNVGERPKMYPSIRYVYKDNIIPFTKEGPERTADSIAKWIGEMTNSHRQDNDSYQQKDLSPYSINDNENDNDDEVEENITIVPDYVESMKKDSQYTSNKYPPYSNQFIARNFNQSNLSKNKSIKRSKSKSQSKSKSRSIRRSKSKSRSKNKSKSKSRSLSRKSSRPRFLTSRRNKSLGTTAMF